MQHMVFLRHVRDAQAKKSFTLSNSLQDPAASKNADFPLEWQRLKETKLQTHLGSHTPLTKDHLAFKHNIDVKWLSCDMCEYRCKQRGDLKRHIAYVHDIDVSSRPKMQPLKIPNYRLNLCKHKLAAKPHATQNNEINHTRKQSKTNHYLILRHTKRDNVRPSQRETNTVHIYCQTRL